MKAVLRIAHSLFWHLLQHFYFIQTQRCIKRWINKQWIEFHSCGIIFEVKMTKLLGVCNCFKKFIYILKVYFKQKYFFFQVTPFVLINSSQNLHSLTAKHLLFENNSDRSWRMNCERRGQCALAVSVCVYCEWFTMERMPKDTFVLCIVYFSRHGSHL